MDIFRTSKKSSSKSRTTRKSPPDITSRSDVPRDPVPDFYTETAVQLSLCAYTNDPAKRGKVLEGLHAKDYSKLQDRRSGTAHGYACIIDRRAWLFFRGSDEIRDWVANLTFLPKEGVHRGFVQEWEKLAPDVFDWLVQHEGHYDDIATTGHSLGGAIAVLCARDAFDRYPGTIAQVITFGAPPVFFNFEANRYAQRKLPDELGAESLRYRNLRVIHRNDIVTSLPGIAGLKHVGDILPLGGEGLWGRLFGFLRRADAKLGATLPTSMESNHRVFISIGKASPTDTIENLPASDRILGSRPPERQTMLRALTLVTMPVWLPFIGAYLIVVFVISALHLGDSVRNHFKERYYDILVEDRDPYSAGWVHDLGG
ncbi:lipase family protein [Marivita hallyeonensis]|uniref:Lipase (Class 3) n=1 Tax=Marivita hallyeonensis TaxID=996342 RepID=A0A1M5VGL1_9RHOB|nr:lipase family protein [Marivita hallyeonensis]SHH74370.1 Lipase (class 3) [Marivita hallyeonensis]